MPRMCRGKTAKAAHLPASRKRLLPHGVGSPCRTGSDQSRPPPPHSSSSCMELPMLTPRWRVSTRVPAGPVCLGCTTHSSA